MTNINAPRSVSEATYGPATAAINRILLTGHSLQFFPAITSVHYRCYELVASHLDIYGMVTHDHVSSHTMVVLGNGVALRQIRGLIKSDNAATDQRWEHKLASVVKAKLDSVKSKELIFKPPLWPVPGLNTVVSQLSIAKPKDVLGAVLPEDRQVFWELAVEVEFMFWAALDWAVIIGDTAQPNPFLPILDLLMLGLYPLGFSQQTFILFGRAPRRDDKIDHVVASTNTQR